MADVISLKDGSTQVIFDNNDFIRFISDSLGYEAGEYAESIITDLQEQADYTTQKVNTDLNAYESQLDSQTAAFQDILSGLDEIQKLINGRLNREELQRIVISCRKEVLNQI